MKQKNMGRAVNSIRIDLSRHVLLSSFLFGLLVLSACGGSSSDKVNFLVNVPPVASASCEKTPLNINLTGDLSSNVMDPDNTIFNFNLVNDGLKGSATIDPTGIFTYTPNFAAEGIDSFSYRVDDLSGGQDTATVTLIIENTRIMPLGDSITTGSSCGVFPRAGYRQQLYENLVAGGYMIDFVGGQSEGAFADPDHEGHSGITAANVAARVIGWLNANPADVIMLHIGSTESNPNGQGDVEAILNAIDSWESANNNPVVVFLARIIDQNPINPDVKTFNDNVQTMVLGRINDRVIMVNQRDALVYPADLCDSKHPKTAGYGKMADQWFPQLTDPTKCFVKN